MITNQEREEIINYLFSKRKDAKSYWEDTYRNIRTLNKGELSLLKIIINEFNNDFENELFYSVKDEQDTMQLLSKRYPNDVPVAIYFHLKSGLYNIRGYLRNLMGKNIIACSEEDNILLIHPIILRKKDFIKKYSEPQNIKNEIKYLVFKHHNYSCYNCGADDNPLKIAFLSSNKNINNIEDMVPICSLCYEDITQNEILIDGSLIFNHFDDENNQQESDTWIFLTNYLPEVKADEDSYTTNIELEDIYGVEQLIKCYAETFFRLTVKGDGIKHMKGFFGYVKAIFTNNKEIKLSEEVKKYYNDEPLLDF